MKKFYQQLLAGLTGVGVVYLILALFQMQFDASQWYGLTQLMGMIMSVFAFVAIFDLTDNRF